MIKDRGILFRSYETGQKQKAPLLRPKKSIILWSKGNTEEREAAKHLLPAACQMILNLEVYRFCRSCFNHAQGRSIPPPLGKAEEKARTILLVLTDAIPVNGNGLFPFLFVWFCFLQI